MPLKRVLSIQSHVASGYVGNNIATIILQINGFEVATINTVSFSNHFGYEQSTGRLLTKEEFKDLIYGLETNKLMNFTHVITGYVRSAELLDEIAKFVKKLKKTNPSIIYFCDPIIGDNNKMYVPEELIAIYRNKLFPLADVITPNQCEAQWLSQSTISDENDVKNIIKILHQMGPKTVIITSVDNKNQSDIMKCYSSYISENENSHINFEYNIQKINFTFSGTGDACSALLLASLDHFKDIQIAVMKTMDIMKCVVLETVEKYKDLDSEKNLSECYKKELAIIECLDILKINQ